MHKHLVLIQMFKIRMMYSVHNVHVHIYMYNVRAFIMYIVARATQIDLSVLKQNLSKHLVLYCADTIPYHSC